MAGFFQYLKEKNMCVITGISAILGATLFSVGSTAVTVGGAIALAGTAISASITEVYQCIKTQELMQKHKRRRRKL